MKRWWMAFASALGWLNTRVILTLVYFTIFAIGAVVLKVIRKDLLARRFHTGTTYWVDKEAVPHSLEQSKHQF